MVGVSLNEIVIFLWLMRPLYPFLFSRHHSYEDGKIIVGNSPISFTYEHPLLYRVKLTTLKLHFTMSKHPSKVPSKITTFDEGCHIASETTVGNQERKECFSAL